MRFRFRKYEFEIPYPVLLLVAAVVSFWQFATFSNVLRCDIQDAMYPWRYFAGECFQNGIFPFWNPYEQFGYPFFADLQYTNWNPEVWLIGNLMGYSYVVLYALIFFYVWLAGYGMYRLANYLSQNRPVAFFIGLTWMLSGCTIAHLQQFVTVIGMAWMPFVVWQFFSFLDTSKWRHVAGFCVFSFLFFTSGYQALYFMLVYFFAVMVIKRIMDLWRSDRAKFKLFLYRSFFLVALFALMFMPVFVALYRTSGFVSRLDHGVSLKDANFSPFSPQSLVSLFLPVVSGKMQNFIATDITMSNLFFGVIPLIFLTFSFLSKKNNLQRILLFFFLIYLLAALGEYLPVRKFMYDYLPLMNLFRLPGLFRVVALFFLLLHLSLYLKNTSVDWVSFKKFVFVFALIYFVIAVSIYCVPGFSAALFLKEKENLFQLFNDSSGLALMFYQSFIFFVLLSLLLLVCVFWTHKLSFNVISFVTFCFLFVGIQFNIYFNVAGEQSPVYVSQKESSYPSGFPLPPSTSVKQYSGLTDRFNHVFSNTGNFLKKPMNDPFSSFQLDGYVSLTDSFQRLKNKLHSLPIAYLSDSILYKNEWGNVMNDSLGLYFSGNNKKFLQFEDLQLSRGDAVHLESFLPNFMQIEVSNARPVLFNLQQSYFPCWEVYSNGKRIQPVVNAGLLMSVPLAKGKHKLEFKFRDDLFLFFYFISIILFFLLISAILYTSGTLLSKFSGVFLFVIFILSVGLFSFRNPTANQEISFTSHLVSASKNVIRSSLKKSSGLNIRNEDPVQFKQALRKIQDCDADKFFYEWEMGQYNDRIVENIRLKYPRTVFQKHGVSEGLMEFSRNGYDGRILKVISHGNTNDSAYFSCNPREIIPGREGVVCPELVLPAKIFLNKKSVKYLVKFNLLAQKDADPKIFFGIEDKRQASGMWFQKIDLQPWMLTPGATNEVVIPFSPDWNINHDAVLHIYFTAKPNDIVAIEGLKLLLLEGYK